MAVLYVNQGQAVLARVRFTYPDGAPMQATGVSIKVRKPDGSVEEGVVEPGPEPGEFEARFVVEIPGHWRALSECTGPEPARDEDRFVCSRLRFFEP